MLQRLHTNQSRNSNPTEAKRVHTQGRNLDVHSKMLRQQEAELKAELDLSSVREVEQPSGSDLFTPATDAFDDAVTYDNTEIARVKKELEAAKSVINRQQQELEETRTFKHTMDQALGPDPDYTRPEQGMSNMYS